MCLRGPQCVCGGCVPCGLSGTVAAGLCAEESTVRAAGPKAAAGSACGSEAGRASGGGGGPSGAGDPMTAEPLRLAQAAVGSGRRAPSSGGGGRRRAAGRRDSACAPSPSALGPAQTQPDTCRSRCWRTGCRTPLRRGCLRAGRSELPRGSRSSLGAGGPGCLQKRVTVGRQWRARPAGDKEDRREGAGISRRTHLQVPPLLTPTPRRTAAQPRR